MFKWIKSLFVPECKHEWTKWESYGYTWQRRQCMKCGLIKDRST